MKKLSIDNPFFRFMDKTGDIVIINLLFLACLVPVITAGASGSVSPVIDLMLVTKAQAGIFWHITGMVAGCLMFLWLLITCWLFPAGIYKGNGIKEAVKRSLFLAVRNFPYTMVMLVLDLIPVICLVVSDYYTALAAPVYFVAGFGLTALINTKIMDRCAC